MTLSNIFFGKKVVQQLYVGQIKLYQSAGWETLPATVQQVWQKSVSSNFDAIAVDSQDNIYTGEYDSYLTKFSSDGTQIWQTKLSSRVNLVATDNQNNVYSGDGSSTLTKFLQLVKE